MPVTVTTRPTRRLRKIIAAYPSVNAASRAFGLDNVTLDRFMKGVGGISADAVASIMESTKLAYDVLFEHADEGGKR
jgi:hypothetical protein